MSEAGHGPTMKHVRSDGSLPRQTFRGGPPAGATELGHKLSSQRDAPYSIAASLGDDAKSVLIERSPRSSFCIGGADMAIRTAFGAWPGVSAKTLAGVVGAAR